MRAPMQCTPSLLCFFVCAQARWIAACNFGRELELGGLSRRDGGPRPEASADARGIIGEIIEGTRASRATKNRVAAANPH